MEQQNIAVLGGGLVGGFIARELARSLGAGSSVTLADVDKAALERNYELAAAMGHPISISQADLSDREVLLKSIEEARLVIGALPGHLGFECLRTVIQSGRDCVDISFCPEDVLLLDPLARSHGVSVIVDCGVMPGLGGMLAAHFASRIREAGGSPQRLCIMVGGLPEVRRWPFEYTAPFSPSDVIEEYVRPARVKENGKVVEYPALSGLELVDFPDVGTLEAFSTDGLRTLLTTLDIPNMVEKTLRYPGHAEKMRLLREMGLFSSEPLSLRDASGADCTVRPLDLADRLLREAWRLPPGEGELTAMRVEVDGCCATLLDRGDPAVQASSMARTTGLPAVIAAKMILDGTFVRPGVTPPERLGEDARLWRRMLVELEAAGVEISITTQ